MKRNNDIFSTFRQNAALKTQKMISRNSFIQHVVIKIQKIKMLFYDTVI